MGRHVAVKRAGMERREADWSAAARARARLRKGTRKKPTVVRRMCAPSRDAGEPAGHNGGKHLSEGGAVCACSDRTNAR